MTTQYFLRGVLIGTKEDDIFTPTEKGEFIPVEGHTGFTDEVGTAYTLEEMEVIAGKPLTTEWWWEFHEAQLHSD